MLKLLLIIVILLSCSSVHGEAGENYEFKTVSTHELLAKFFSTKSKKVILDPRLPKNLIVYGNKDEDEPAESEIFEMLRVTGYTMIENENFIKVVRLNELKGHAEKVIEPKIGLELSPSEFVTTYISLEKADALRLIPVIRPMSARYAHVAAIPGSNGIIISDHYSNIERLIEVIQKIDSTWDKDNVEQHR